MANSTATHTNDQYALAKMLGIWSLGGAPMWILGWLVYPAISKGLTVADAGLGAIWKWSIELWQTRKTIA